MLLFKVKIFCNNIPIEKLLLTLRVLKSATIDLLACRTGFEWGQLSVLLLELELEGLIVQNNNQEYQLR